ncbi:hypothetical protein O181_109501 [Austropuccinia psidii MF-1]|uniref:Uncharacterized protein n=1 Tax=Austropuccinia psidii MF-1 TaxID=1389203 RepID=A0A9Q3JXE3_9BASI|nr:hypothetical protein [Austropuccinia psidii MF-1]
MHYTKCVVYLPSFPSFEWDFFIKDSPKGEELILGCYFLYHFNPIIYWKNGLITYASSHKDSSGISLTTGNEFSTDPNSVALVDELNKHSLAFSVHIPPIIPSQSLLPSRDELSFNAILAEQPDEEEELEEIETVLNVVPHVYHHYLDVFSKMKAEKIPPHFSCDHHIELEGLLHQSVLSTLCQITSQKHYRSTFQRV